MLHYSNNYVLLWLITNTEWGALIRRPREIHRNVRYAWNMSWYRFSDSRGGIEKLGCVLTSFLLLKRSGGEKTLGIKTLQVIGLKHWNRGLDWATGYLGMRNDGIEKLSKKVRNTRNLSLKNKLKTIWAPILCQSQINSDGFERNHLSFIRGRGRWMKIRGYEITALYQNGCYQQVNHCRNTTNLML